MSKLKLSIQTFSGLASLQLFRPSLGCLCQKLPKRYLSTQQAKYGVGQQLKEKDDRLELGPFFINYIKVGHGPHVVFCFPGILGSFKTQLSTLITGFDRKKFTLVTWDQPGYGLSRPPERVFTDDSLAEDADYLAKFMHRLGFKKYSVMGWSGGGCSALLFAIKYPQLIDKLVVWGAVSHVTQDDARLYKWFSDPKNTTGKTKEALVAEYGEPFFNKHFPIWMNLMERIYTVRRGELCSKNLPKINASTLVLHGSKDRMVMQRHAEFLRDSIPEAKLHLWENGKHNLHIRYPEEFNQIVQQFLVG